MAFRNSSDSLSFFWQRFAASAIGTRLSRIWHWLTFAQCQDPLRLVLNRGFAVVLVVMTIIAALATPVFASSTEPAQFLLLLTLPVCVFSWWLNRGGTIYGATLFVLWAILILVLGAVPSRYAAADAPIQLVWAIPLVVATLFIGPRAGLWSLALLMTGLGTKLFFSQVPPQDALRFMLIATLDFSALTAVLIVGASIFSRALRGSIATGETLHQVNAELTQRILEQKHIGDALRARELNAQSLLRLSQKLERAQTYVEAMNAALDEVKTVIGYQNLWVYLISEDREYARALVARGETAEPAVQELQTLRIRGDRMLEEIAEAKHIVVVEDARTDERTDKAIVAALGNRTIVNIPILLFDQHIGAMGTGTFGDEGVRVPTPSEQEYLLATASHMAVTLDRIHLLDQRQEAETLRAGQNEILEMIAASAPLEETLTRLTRVIEAQAPGMLCSVILLEPDGQHMRHYAGPSLPKAYTKSIDGLAIGPRAGSCGTAMFLGKPVIVTDILQDALWDDYREFAIPHGLRACWSTPFFSHSGQVLGSFAMYYREPRHPSPAETRLIELATNIAGIAVERKQAETALRVAEENYRSIFESAVEGIYQSTPDGRVQSANPALARIVGYDSPAEFIAAISDLATQYYVNPEERRHFVQTVKESGEVHNLEYEAYRKDGAKIWVSDNARNVRDTDGTTLYYEGFITDITERKRVEEAERDQRALAEALRDTAAALNSTLNVDDVLERLLRNVSQVVPHDAANVMLIDSGIARVVRSHGYAERGVAEAIHEMRFVIADTPHQKQMLETGQPVIINDAPAYSSGRLIPETQWVQSFMGAPIRIQEQVIGFLFLDSATRGFFTAAHAVKLQAFADQAAIAIQNARLFEQVQQRADEFAGLYEITRDLAIQTGLPALLDSIVSHARHLLRAPVGGMNFYDALRDEVELVVGQGASVPVGTRIPSGIGAAGRVVQTRAPVIIDDYQTWTGRIPELVKLGHRATLHVPMLYSGALIGTLYVTETGDSTRTFNETDVRLLSLFAAQAASAVHNARLFAETQHHAAQLSTINEIGRAVSTLQDLDGLLQVIYQQVQRVLSLDLFFVGLYDSDTDYVSFPLVFDEGIRYTPPSDRLEHNSTMWRVVESGTPIWIDRSAAEVKAPVNPQIGIGNITKRSAALLFVPLMVGTETIGVISAQSYTLHNYTHEHLALLSGVANQAAVAVQNARLFEQAHKRADEFAALYETARDLAAQPSVPALLNTILERAMGLLAVPFGSIYLYDRARGDLELISIKGIENPIGLRIQLGEGISGQTAQARKTLIIDDYPNWEFRSPRFADAPLKTAICVPMLYGGEIIGVVNLGELAPSARKFTKADERLLSLFASQAASVVHDAHLLEETRRRLAELEAVNRISKRLRVARAVEEMLPPLLDETLTVLESQAGGIWLYEESDQNLHRVIASGWLNELTEPPIQPGEGIVGTVFATDEPHLTPEITTDPLTLARVREQIPNGWGGVCVPIRTVQQVIGALFVAVPSPRQVSQPQVHLLTTIAEIAGNAIHRTRLHLQTERRLQRLIALQAIDASISSILDLPVTLNVLLGQVINQLRVDAADILLFNSHTQSLSFAAGLGFRSKAIEQSYLRIGEGFAGRAAMERHTVTIPDLGSVGSAFLREKMQGNENFVAYYGVPLIAKGRVLGVLEIFHRAALAPDPEWLDFLEALAKQAAIAIDNTELFDSLQRSNQELELAYDATIKGWSRALDLRDKETEGHTRRVTELTERLARLLGFSDEELVHVRRGALLHDIGKMGVPDSILLKPAPLTPEEWMLMRQHPSYAYEMLYPIKYLRPALDIPYCHHERWDGSGYPRGLKGEQIPIAARIFAVVDVWDALRSDRPYREAWDETRVREYIHSMLGIHFDPIIGQVFLNLKPDAFA